MIFEQDLNIDIVAVTTETTSFLQVVIGSVEKENHPFNPSVTVLVFSLCYVVRSTYHANNFGTT